MFLINTRGLNNTSSNCFLNCLVMAMFGYSKSPFYTINSFPDKDSETIYKCFRKIIDNVIEDNYPDISFMRNALPIEMRYGQQDCLETFDTFMKIFSFEPMKIKMVRESKNKSGKTFKGKSIIQNISYLTLNNNGDENADPVKELFYPSEWEDLGPNPNSWVQDKKDIPSFRWTRQKIY